MPRRPSAIRAAHARGIDAVRDLAREFRLARTDHAISQAELESVTGHSRSVISRFERGLLPNLALPLVSELLAGVGLTISTRAFPDGEPLRDRAQVGVIDAIRGRLHPGLRARMEAPLPIAGDRRAWDLLVIGRGWSVGIEVETRPGDLQALLRRVALKERDGDVTCVVVVMPATRHNRQLVRAHAATLATAFPFPGDRALDRLAAGAAPGGSALVLLPMAAARSGVGGVAGAGPRSRAAADGRREGSCAVREHL